MPLATHPEKEVTYETTTLLATAVQDIGAGKCRFVFFKKDSKEVARNHKLLNQILKPGDLVKAAVENRIK